MNDAAALPNPEYGEVLDTKKVFFRMLNKRMRKLLTMALLSLAWSLACIVFLPNEVLLSQLGLLLTILPWFGIIVWLCILYSKIREAFWKQLALKYNCEYTPSKDLSEEKALLFSMGHSAYAQHGIRGNYNGQPFHVFEYEYSIGSGKNRRTYSFTVFEIKFTGTFPHLYLNYKSDWYSNTPSVFAPLADIPVPGEFEAKFKLYAPKEYEIETLQIFTPDIFALLIDSKWNHDMEFVDGELVIYRKVRFGNFTDLDAEFNKIKKLVDILSPLLNKLKLAQIGDISPLLH